MPKSFLATILAKAGINVGTATGAGAGEVRASGDVFALGKVKGLQAQIVDYTQVDASAWIALTTAYQVLTGCTVTFTPTINETVMLWMTFRLQCNAGTAICNANDTVRALIHINAVVQNGGVELGAPGGTGIISGSMVKKFSLTANTAYTIDMRATNLAGNRGAGIGNFMMLRLAG